jgi:SRSO17 transposase
VSSVGAEEYQDSSAQDDKPRESDPRRDWVDYVNLIIIYFAFCAAVAAA